MQLSANTAHRMFVHSERMGQTVERTMAETLDSAMDWYYLASMYRAGTAGRTNGYTAYILSAAAREIANRNTAQLEWLHSMLDA